MLAQAFSAYATDPTVVIFASGVSDSGESRPAAFRRESELLRRTRAAHPEALLVYFGTCSVNDPDLRDTPYVRHKVEMERQLEASPGPWLVLRLPLAIGPGHRGSTLAKFLHDRIAREEAFDVWTGARRYPIDVEDAFRIAATLIADPSMWRRRVCIALRSYAILDFVRILESITGKRARFRLVDKGRGYELHCPEAARLVATLHIDAGEDYLQRVLWKYFSRG